MSNKVSRFERRFAQRRTSKRPEPRAGMRVIDGYGGVYKILDVEYRTSLVEEQWIKRPKRLLLREPDGTRFILAYFRLEHDPKHNSKNNRWRLLAEENRRAA